MIEDREQFIEELKKARGMLADAQRISGTGFWDWDVINNEFLWSDEIYRIFGHKPQEFKPTYENFLNSVHPDDKEFVKKSIDGALYDKSPYSIDHRIILPNGIVRIVHEQAEVTFQKYGRPIRMLGIIQEITERKEAEEKLIESEKKFKSLFMDSPIGIELYGSNGKLIDTNKACLNIFGITDITEVKGFDLFKNPNIPENDMAKLKKGETVSYEVAFDFDKVKRFNLYNTTKSGLIHIDVLITPLYLKGTESISNYVVQVQDITMRKKADIELKKYKENLEDIVQSRTLELEKINKRLKEEINERMKIHSKITQIFNSSIPICVIDNHHNITRVNDTYISFFRVNKDDIIGEKCYKIMTGHRCHTSKCTLKQILEGQESIEYEKKKDFNEDTKISYMVRATPNKNQDGDIIGILENFTDISDRKFAEQKFKMIFNAASDAIFIHDFEGNFLEVNQMACERLGYTREELLQMTTIDISSPKYIPSIPQKLEKLIQNKNLILITEHLRRDGTALPIEASCRLIEYQGKEAILCIARDITERKRFEKMRNEFVSTASHQLRTPIAALQQCLENLNKYKNRINEETKEKLMNTITRNVALLSELVEDLQILLEIDTEVNFNK